MVRIHGTRWLVVDGFGKKKKEKKRTCRSVFLARIRKEQYKRSLPSVFIRNVRSIYNERNVLGLRIRNKLVKNCCILLITNLSKSKPVRHFVGTGKKLLAISDVGCSVYTYITTHLLTVLFFSSTQYPLAS